MQEPLTEGDNGGKGPGQRIKWREASAVPDLRAETKIRADAFGDDLLAALRKEGIDVSGVKRLADTATGVASIYVADGDNSILVVPGANDQVTPADIDQHLDKLKEADIVLLQLEIPVETVFYAARIAKSLGKKVILNPAPARELPQELYGCIDYMTPNRTELGRYAGMGADTSDTNSDFLRLAMRRLKELLPRVRSCAKNSHTGWSGMRILAPAICGN
ncbi:PfkB family carbohydrate kinase [Paenibacillus phoenicis]